MSEGTPFEGWKLGGKHLDRVLIDAQREVGDSLWRDAKRRLNQNKAARRSLRFLIFFCVLSFLAPLLPLPSPNRIELQGEPQPPQIIWTALMNPRFGQPTVEQAYWKLSWVDEQLFKVRKGIFGPWQTGSWMGTDAKGRDILSRIIWGSRTSILVALAATLCSLVIGVIYGALAGLLGGWVDNLMMRFVDVLYSIPFIFIVIFVMTFLSSGRTGPGSELVDREKVFFIVIGAIYWLTMARVVRGQVLSLKNSEFIEAARSLGASTTRILFAHIVPNVLSVVIVYLTLTIPAVMLFEAFLSFLGLGIRPPKVSWGLLAVDGTEAINPIENFWWLVVFPSLAMGSCLLALNILGDGLRDALDPKLRGRR